MTERGTVYSLDEIAALTGLASDHGLPTHMDGARFANALASVNCSPGDMTWRAGVDVLSFGGTKNGLMAVEAVVLFDPGGAEELAFRRKRGAQLWSKHRYLSAQMVAYLADGLWLELARAANAAAARLGDGLAALRHARILHPRQANMIFVELPRAAHRRAVESGASYFLTISDLAGGGEDDMVPARLVTNWATTDAEVDRFLTLVG